MNAEQYTQSLDKSLLQELEFIDLLTSAGEGPDEIELLIKKASENYSKCFGIWLVAKRRLDQAEFFSQAVGPLLEHVYLYKCSRQASLAKVTKASLSEFLNCLDFSVDQTSWDAGVTPFQFILSFYEFLEAINYPANLKRRINAVKAIEKERPKHPVNNLKLH